MTREEDIRARLDAAHGRAYDWPDQDYWQGQFFSEDAALIAHAPDDLRYLLGRYEQLVGAVRRVLRDAREEPAEDGGCIWRFSYEDVGLDSPADFLHDALPPEARAP